MPKRMTLIVPTLTLLLGAGLASIGFLFSPKKEPPPPPASSVLCFLKKKNAQVPPIFQVNGTAVSRNEIPPDLQEGFLQMELDHYARLEAFSQRLALRLDAVAAQTPQPNSSLPTLEEVLKTAPSDAEVQGYYEGNKAAFGKIPLSEAQASIRALLTRQNENLKITTRMKKLREENRYHSLHPLPCGPEIPLPLDNDTPARGSTTSEINITYLLDYNCSMCSHLKSDLDSFLNQNLSRIRLWLLIHPGEKNTRSDWLARGAHCAFKLDAAKFPIYHNQASSMPILGSEELRTGTISGKEITLAIAEKAQVEKSSFEKCLTAPETETRMEQIRSLAARHGISGPPAFFINGRRLLSEVPTEITSTFSLVLSEADRLRNQLQ